MTEIRVLVVDDQPVVRAGLTTILSSQPDLAVVGEAGDGAEAVAQVARLDPDVVLLDIRMPGTDGLTAARQMLAAGAVRPRVVVMTTFDLDEYVHEALRIGVSGFILKDAPRAQVADAVRIAAAGDALIDPRVTRRLIARFASQPPPPALGAPALDQLTDREREVLVLIGRGRTNGEIAAELFVGESTVKTHVNRLFAKLHLRDRAQAVIAAYEAGLVGDAG